MSSICFYFQVHQPFRLRTYRFFEIGDNHHYYDDFKNRDILRRVADKCYLPTNKVLLDLINEYGKAFKISYSISGVALDQFEMYTPDVIKSFQKLAKTGCVEFLSETYSHSLSSLRSKDEFFAQIKAHQQKIEQLFGQKTKTFRNTELIYSDGIGDMVAELGFNTMLTEGAKHILGWKSPNYLYCNARNPKLKLLLKNYQLSDDIAFRFSQHSWKEWPLTAEKFVSWLTSTNSKEDTINLFMDYETFGEHQWPETGIFEFLKALPKFVFQNSQFTFNTPSELAAKLQPVASLHVPYPISWADEERDLTAWLGNELQENAFNALYSLEDKVKKCNDENIQRDWKYLQTSDHFYYMCTKWFSDGDVHKYFNPYNTPYEAFINYMNIISDFIIRLDKTVANSPVNVKQEKPEPKKRIIKKDETLKKHTVKKTAISKPVTKLETAKAPLVKIPKAPVIKSAKSTEKIIKPAKSTSVSKQKTKSAKTDKASSVPVSKKKAEAIKKDKSFIKKSSKAKAVKSKSQSKQKKTK